MDPLLDIIRLLRPKATLWGRIDGHGEWSISFRKRNLLLFCWVAQGGCMLVRPESPPVELRPDDFVLIRTSSPFWLTTDSTVAPGPGCIDVETVVPPDRRMHLTVGAGEHRSFVLHGGRFVFDTGNEQLLSDLLPSLVIVPREHRSLSRVRLLLQMSESESDESGPESEFIIRRLMDLVLVELLRGKGVFGDDERALGLVGGLRDPVVARALSAMHADIARPWTIGSLADLCHMSRSKFASLFRQRVGAAPIEYLQRVRMARAKAALQRGDQSISQIAFASGFQSASAFSTAFTRMNGCAPRTFAAL